MAKGKEKSSTAPQPKQKAAPKSSHYCLYITAILIAVAAYFLGFLDFGIEDYEKFHHERVQNFYGQILVDYHEYHGGYLTFGLWKNYTTGERITKYEEAAENLYEELARRGNITKDSQLLDVACGMASQDVYLYNRFGCNITAVDLLDKHISIGQQKMIKRGLQDKVKLVHASATNLPFANESFTHVMCAEGGPHMHTREQFWRETMRVLKPGGVFTFSETTITDPNPNFIVRLMYRAVGYLWRCSHDNFYDNTEYIKKLEAIGFTDIKLIGTNLDVYPDYQKNSWDDREQLYQVRGKIVTWGGALIDVFLRAMSEYELIDYVLVTGVKPLNPKKV
jgi:microcystin synthetase protein McyJ